MRFGRGWVPKASFLNSSTLSFYLHNLISGGIVYSHKQSDAEDFVSKDRHVSRVMRLCRVAGIISLATVEGRVKHGTELHSWSHMERLQMLEVRQDT